MQKPITRSIASPPMSTARPASISPRLVSPAASLACKRGQVDQAGAVEQADVIQPGRHRDDPLEVAAKLISPALTLAYSAVTSRTRETPTSVIGRITIRRMTARVASAARSCGRI